MSKDSKKLQGSPLKEVRMGQVKSSHSTTHLGPRALAGATLGQNLGHRLYILLHYPTSIHTSTTIISAPAARWVPPLNCSPKNYNATPPLNQPISCSALVDSGSDLSVVSKTHLKELGIIALPLSIPLHLEVIDGTILKSGTITHYTFVSLIH